jgi:hypothetical protein
MAEMDDAIPAKGLVKTYRGGVRALDGVSLVADRFLVSPAGHGLQIAGRLIQRAMVGVIQALIIIALGLVMGATYPGGIAGRDRRLEYRLQPHGLPGRLHGGLHVAGHAGVPRMPALHLKRTTARAATASTGWSVRGSCVWLMPWGGIW